MHAEFQPSRISAEISAELSTEILKAGFCICFGINYYMQNSADLSTDVPRVFWEKVGWGGAREAIRPKFCMHNSVEISLKLCMQNCVEMLAKIMYADFCNKN